MGQGEPGDCDRELIAVPGDEHPGGPATVEYLEDWELNGATWQVAAISDQHAVIDLCSCSGERMDRVESDDPEVIAYVRARGGSS